MLHFLYYPIRHTRIENNARVRGYIREVYADTLRSVTVWLTSQCQTAICHSTWQQCNVTRGYYQHSNINLYDYHFCKHRTFTVTFYQISFSGCLFTLSEKMLYFSLVKRSVKIIKEWFTALYETLKICIIYNLKTVLFGFSYFCNEQKG